MRSSNEPTDTSCSHQLVDHFFRHESGRLVSALTHDFGIRRLELAEDAVQHALSRALQTWGQRGVPSNPSGWLYRVARNQLIDTLRRLSLEARYQQGQISASADAVAMGDGEWETLDNGIDAEIADESLRLLFLCCHPTLPFESRVAVALKLVGGFSTQEVSTALMISQASAEKRIYRAMGMLRDEGLELTDLAAALMHERLEAVESTIYLMFNEGYASLSEAAVLRRDVCEEAVRLCRMLVNSSVTGTDGCLDGAMGFARPATHALLALMLMHLARFDARVGAGGMIVVLEDQDRGLWNYAMIREAMDWMTISATSNHVSRYHLEAAIAWEHCRAKSFGSVDWGRIVELYKMLLQVQASPMVRLNLAIAVMYAMGADVGLDQLTAIDGKDRQRLRPWWDAALATAHQRLGNHRAAAAHFEDALALTDSSSLKQFFACKVAAAKAMW